MKRESLPADTGVGAVHLSVTDLDRSVGSYRDIVGLRVTFEDEARVVMGADETELIALYPGATRPVAEGTTGLYHLATVVPNLAAATTCKVVAGTTFAPAASCAGRTQPALKGALAKLPAQELEGVE